MSLKTTIESEMKAAMLAKNADRLRALRALKSLILLEETSGKGVEISIEAELKLLTKAAKQRKDAADIFRAQNREDLLEKELSELAVIEEFLPKQFSEDEVKQKLLSIIGEIGAKTAADMGKVMGIATKELAGKAEGKLISTLVKQLLS